MSRRYKKRLCLLLLLLLASVWWIYSQYFRWTKEKTVLEAISSDKDIENAYKKILSWKKRVRSVHNKKRLDMEMTSNDNKIVSTKPYSLITRRVSKFKKLEKNLMEKKNDDKKFIEELEEMLQGESLSRDIEFEEDFLRIFITASNYNIDKARFKLQNFLNLRLKHRYFFKNMDFDFTQIPEYRFVTLLPHRSKDGSATYLFELGKWDPDKIPLEHLKKIAFMIYMQELRHPLTQANGFNVIYDFADAGIRYAKFATPHNIFLMQHVCFEAVPAKYAGIHLINMNFAGNLLLTLIKPFLPDSIAKVLYIHTSAKELIDFVPVSSLPEKYGGTLVDYYMSDWIRKANEQHENFPIEGQKNIL